MIICSEELKLALKCEALHHTELKDAIISHLAFASEYLGEVKGPKTHFQTYKKAQFKLKSPFCELIQNVKKVNKNRTVFTYEEICSSFSKYIIDRKAQLFRGQDIKIAWVQDDPLGICFNMPAFHVTQAKILIWSQLIPFKARQSSRLLNKNK